MAFRLEELILVGVALDIVAAYLLSRGLLGSRGDTAKPQRSLCRLEPARASKASAHMRSACTVSAVRRSTPQRPNVQPPVLGARSKRRPPSWDRRPRHSC